MAFQVSPGVLVQERDLTRIIEAYQQVLKCFVIKNLEKVL